VTSIRSSHARGAAALLIALGLSPFAQAQVFDYDLQGPTTPAYFGYDINRIGDLDRDGCEDFIVGAPKKQGVSDDGEAIVFSGSTGAVLATLDGNTNSLLGASVDGRIDADGDGYPDVLVGAFNDASGGRVVVFSPHQNKILLDLYGTGPENLGASVRSLLDDIDGDGVNDFIAGADTADKAYVYSGATGAVIFTKTGQSGAFFGYSVSAGGDMDGDGVHDFLIGAPWHVGSGGKQTGRVTAWSGKDGSQLWGTDGAADSLFGFSLAHPGDLDGDGRGDCVVGAPNHLDPNGNYTGAVIALSGASGSAIYKVYGDQALDDFGSSVRGMSGDVDQDGTDDFIAGALFSNGDVGYARLFSGATGNVLFTYYEKTSDPSVASCYGAAVAGGDVDGDGRTDVLIGGSCFDFNTGIVETWITAVAKWYTYGNGWSGTLGVPMLTGLTNPVVGQSLSLSLSNSAGVTTVGLLLIGVNSAAIPTGKGGTLLVAPLLYIPVSLPPGGLTLTGSIPNDPSLYGFDLYLQGLELDAGASKGLSFTPGLDLYFGFP
jgi:hypothetical protein